MALAPTSEQYLSYYSYSLLEAGIKKLTGTGNTRFLGSSSGDIYSVKYNLVDGAFSGMTEHLLKSLALTQALRSFYLKDNYLNLYERFKQEYPFADRTKRITALHERIMKVAPEQKAFGFALKDLNDQPIKLTDLKGKPVFLVFVKHYWSEEQILKFSKIKNVLKEKGIQAVFIASDEKVIETLKSEEIEGIKLKATQQEWEILIKEFCVDIFRLHPFIDSDGKIIDYIQPNIISNEKKLASSLEIPALVDALKIKYLKRIIYSLITVLMTGILGLFIYRKFNSSKLKIVQLNSKVQELELTAIRAQMNPHFLYNALNSIQNLVQESQLKEANIYISQFASLIRSVLEYTASEEITLAEELQMLEKYIVLEQLRFAFEFKVNISQQIDSHQIFIPPLLLQPIVENAIVHGLAKKSGDRRLSIDIAQTGEHVSISIIDNGVGFYSPKKPTSGLGLKLSNERLELMTEKYGQRYELKIREIDKKKGTTIILTFPIE